MKTRMTLSDGTTMAVRYPLPGWNCQNYGVYSVYGQMSFV